MSEQTHKSDDLITHQNVINGKLRRFVNSEITIYTTKGKNDNNTLKLAGGITDSSLNWDTHISDLSNKIDRV